MAEGKFKNYLSDDNEYTNDAVEFTHAWYIKMGFAGFNSPANNRFGYKTKDAAEAAILRYQGRSKN